MFAAPRQAPREICGRWACQGASRSKLSWAVAWSASEVFCACKARGDFGGFGAAGLVEDGEQNQPASRREPVGDPGLLGQEVRRVNDETAVRCRRRSERARSCWRRGLRCLGGHFPWRDFGGGPRRDDLRG